MRGSGSSPSGPSQEELGNRKEMEGGRNRGEGVMTLTEEKDKRGGFLQYCSALTLEGRRKKKNQGSPSLFSLVFADG